MTFLRSFYFFAFGSLCSELERFGDFLTGFLTYFSSLELLGEEDLALLGV
jgi:hypothetical protein